MVAEIIVEAKVKAVKWVAVSVVGITLPLPLLFMKYKITRIQQYNNNKDM